MAESNDKPREKPCLIPLLPRHRIALFTDGYGDSKRFIKLFRDTWGRIPKGVRCTLLKHWRTAVPSQMTKGKGDYQFFPTVELVRYKSNFSRGDSGDALAQCSFNGYSLAFLQPIFDRLPPDLVRETIAHELIHALHWAEGQQFDDADFAHDEVNMLLEEWGFSPCTPALHDWMDANPDLVTEEEPT